VTDTSPQNIRPRHRPQRLVEFAHGWIRRTDPAASIRRSAPGHYSRAPAGTSLLLLLIVGVFTGLGIVRVHASTRVLEMGSEITDLTDEQARLLDQHRRLGAERAYLRHPDQIGSVARDKIGMIPMSPDLVQVIRLKESSPKAKEAGQ